MSDAAVVLSRLTKVFGSLPAVVDLSISVARGEIYGLLGPNGAGKTTALRMLAGLVSPTSGHAWLAGIDLDRNADTARTRLGYLSASTGLYARLSPSELLTFFGRAHGMPHALLQRRIRELAEALGLVSFLDRRSGTLSTGEKQRVSLARAVLHDPPVLILDEPTNGLDVLASRFLRDFLRVERTRGKAIIFSTHYLAEAELLCDRIGLLYRGSLIREGTPESLRAESGASTLEQAFLTLVGTSEPGPHAAPSTPLSPHAPGPPVPDSA